jgi:hypothetical protein
VSPGGKPVREPRERGEAGGVAPEAELPALVAGLVADGVPDTILTIA